MDSLYKNGIGGMRMYAQLQTESTKLPTGQCSASGGTQVSQVPPSAERQGSLEQAGLTSLQLLLKSGNVLLSTMQKSDDPKQIVELAHALAATVQTQANLYKVMKP